MMLLTSASTWLEPSTAKNTSSLSVSLGLGTHVWAHIRTPLRVTSSDFAARWSASRAEPKDANKTAAPTTTAQPYTFVMVSDPYLSRFQSTAHSNSTVISLVPDRMS